MTVISESEVGAKSPAVQQETHLKSTSKVIAFEALSYADLIVDAIYQSGKRGNAGDDPLPALLRLANQGGFRRRGTPDQLEMLALTSSLADVDWPDELDRETGVLTYFGDNKKPGHGLHETPKQGNLILQNIFANAHAGIEGRRRVPPIFVFGNTGTRRDLIFLGLAVPGTADLRASEDLVAIWKIGQGKRFQNYRARFTILDAQLISRAWINDVVACNPHSDNAPAAWVTWVDGGRAQALLASRSIEYRKKGEQLPRDLTGVAIIEQIHSYFGEKSHEFEACATAIARLLLPNIATMDLTRPSRDGGRDAVGTLRLGEGSASIIVDFALEAKCYALTSSVGVKEMSRLISRLRHRQFGILVTTSYVDVYAYKEIKEDQHPIIVISAGDIAELLKRNGKGDAPTVLAWLESEFPRR